MDELRAWLILESVPGVGPVTVSRLLSALAESADEEDSEGDITALFDCSDGHLHDLGLSREQVRALRHPGIGVEEALRWADGPGNRLICRDSPEYPPLLREVPAAPLLLYCRGELDVLCLPQIAMVGSRHPSYAGKDNAARLARALASSGLAITSGLALGIDGVCHQQALAVGGITLAVLGSGLDQVYPKRHQPLAEQILINGGLLISEFSPDKGPLAEHFPRRNRIISGLSLGTLVVEAAEQSGSLITARYALEQGREVFAVPGAPQNEQALGCNRLIQQGAKLVLNAEDVLAELNWTQICIPPGGAGAVSNANADESADVNAGINSALPYADLLDNVDYETTSVDTVAERTELPVEVVLGRLVELELAGVVIAVAGGYVRARRANHV